MLIGVAAMLCAAQSNRQTLHLLGKRPDRAVCVVTKEPAYAKLDLFPTPRNRGVGQAAFIPAVHPRRLTTHIPDTTPAQPADVPRSELRRRLTSRRPRRRCPTRPGSSVGLYSERGVSNSTWAASAACSSCSTARGSGSGGPRCCHALW